MKLTEKINFRQPKYMLPAILYIPILFLGFFVIRLFGTEKAEVDKSNLETTEFFNDKLPDANIKGDGIGDKYTNMLNDFGKIKDESAVENIERGGEDIKEEYTSQYSDAEVAAMDPNSKQAQESLERLKQLQEQMRQQQSQDNHFADDRTGGNTSEEDETLENLRKALADVWMEGQRQASGAMTAVENSAAETGDKTRQQIEQKVGEVSINENAVTEISEEAEAEEVVKTQKETSDYFNTITTNEPQNKLIKAIVDENVKAVDGSRVRLRLLDDIDVTTSSLGRWGMQALQNAYQKTANAISKNIRKNKVNIKYGTQVYLINSKEKRKEK